MNEEDILVSKLANTPIRVTINDLSSDPSLYVNAGVIRLEYTRHNHCTVHILHPLQLFSDDSRFYALYQRGEQFALQFKIDEGRLILLAS